MVKDLTQVVRLVRPGRKLYPLSCMLCPCAHVYACSGKWQGRVRLEPAGTNTRGASYGRSSRGGEGSWACRQLLRKGSASLKVLLSWNINTAAAKKEISLKEMSWKSKQKELGTMAQACNSSIQEPEAGGLTVSWTRFQKQGGREGRGEAEGKEEEREWGKAHSQTVEAKVTCPGAVGERRPIISWKRA